MGISASAAESSLGKQQQQAAVEEDVGLASLESLTGTLLGTHPHFLRRAASQPLNVYVEAL
jgi:hypothetical protein